MSYHQIWAKYTRMLDELNSTDQTEEERILKLSFMWPWKTGVEDITGLWLDGDKYYEQQPNYDKDKRMYCGIFLNWKSTI